MAMLYVDADNAPALSLYRFVGFSVDHRDQAYVGDIPAGNAHLDGGRSTVERVPPARSGGRTRLDNPAKHVGDPAERE